MILLRVLAVPPSTRTAATGHLSRRRLGSKNQVSVEPETIRDARGMMETLLYIGFLVFVGLIVWRWIDRGKGIEKTIKRRPDPQ